MKKILILFLFVTTCGCSSMEVKSQDEVFGNRILEVVAVEQQAQQKEEKKETSIENVYLGMTDKDISRIMGEEMVVGYQKNRKTGVLEKINMSTVYRMETLKAGTKRYLVKYYFTAIDKADGIISEEELAPLVFEENRLVGSSWDFLFRLKNELSF